MTPKQRIKKIKEISDWAEEMREKECYLGLHGESIKAVDIPFDYEELQNLDRIENYNKTCELQYLKEYNVYILVTNDFTKFVSNRDRFQSWKKV